MFRYIYADKEISILLANLSVMKNKRYNL